AAAMQFSYLEGRLALHPLLIPVVLAITVPVTTVLLARVSLFRQRAADADRSVATTVQPRAVTDADRHRG
ncbi:MAG TPA: hypothetical protein VN259_13335, partial [Xanthomonadales bacterium]|nr:hypothetical protein [Xanthomonadales bacterium]